MCDTPFQMMEVHDLVDPSQVATFTRPEAGIDLIQITIGTETVYCQASTLQTVAAVLANHEESHAHNN